MSSEADATGYGRADLVLGLAQVCEWSADGDAVGEGRAMGGDGQQ